MILGRIATGRFGYIVSGGWWLFLFAAISTLVSWTALAQQTPAGKGAGGEAQGFRRARLYGIASSGILNHVNHNDARAALKVWFDLVGQQRGFLLDSRVDIIDTVAEIRARLQSHSADLVMMGIPAYLELESSHLVAPVLTDARGAQRAAAYSYVLLVNRSQTAASVGGMRGKNILVFSRDGQLTGTAWLEVMLNKEKLGRAASFFGSLKVAEKAQSCILPLFFGTVDACVVDEVNLNLASEMNPQLRQLRVIARSRPVIESVIVMPTEPYPYQKELFDAMLSLHEDPRGRQLLMVFRTDRLVRLLPEDLESVRELWKEYDRVLAPQPDRGAGSGPAPGTVHSPVGGKEGY